MENKFGSYHEDEMWSVVEVLHKNTWKISRDNIVKLVAKDSLYYFDAQDKED